MPEQRKEATRWFIFCENTASSELIELALKCTQKINHTPVLFLCADGTERLLYEVPDNQFANQFNKAGKQGKLKIQRFISQNGEKPKIWVQILRKNYGKDFSLPGKNGKIKMSALIPR